MAPVATVVILDLLLLGLLGLLTTFVHDLDVIVKDGSNDRNHVGLNHAGPNTFGASNSYVHDALEGQVPFPHVHHVFAPALLEDADESLDSSIDGQNVSDAGGRGCEVGEMIKRVNQGQGRRAVEGPAVIQGGGDAHRRLVDVGDAEVDFPHFGVSRLGMCV